MAFVMTSLPVLLAAFAFGLAALTWSANHFVDSCATIAHRRRISPLLIGLSLVALGTSAPELVVSALAAAQGTPQLAVGNALGSNIANVGLVLGVVILISPPTMARADARWQLPTLLGTTALAGVALWDGHLGRLESLGLLCALGCYLFMLTRVPESPAAVEEDMTHKGSPMLALPSLVMLLGASQLLIWSARLLALHFGVSDMVIGITAVALGTSLPELMAALIGAIKRHHGLAVGTVAGSNIFNLLGVMPLAGVIHPLALDAGVLMRDYLSVAVLTALAVAAFAAALVRPVARPHRLLGALFLLLYGGYYFWLFGW